MEEKVVVPESVMLFSGHGPHSQAGGIQPAYSLLIQHCCIIDDEVGERNWKKDFNMKKGIDFFFSLWKEINFHLLGFMLQITGTAVWRSLYENCLHKPSPTHC